MKFEFSAGGIVYKKIKSKYYILVSQSSSHHGWVFPKGLIGDHHQKEGEEETALREVREETGVHAKIIRPLSPLAYWYQWEGEKRRKTVYYYLMEYVSGDIGDHDFEMEKVEWLPLVKVEDRLTYKGDKKVWSEAREYILNNDLD